MSPSPAGRRWRRGKGESEMVWGRTDRAGSGQEERGRLLSHQLPLGGKGRGEKEREKKKEREREKKQEKKAATWHSGENVLVLVSDCV